MKKNNVEIDGCSIMFDGYSVKKNPKGVFVGTFSKDDLIKGKDKIAVEQKKKETGLNYTNTRLTKDGLKIWVCDVNDMEW